MNGQQALVPTFGGAEARRLTNELKRDAQALWSKLIELYEGGAHTALNYASWHEYCSAEFGFGKSHSYRLLDAGRVARAIPPAGEREPGPRATVEPTAARINGNHVINERQARELVPLLRAEDEDAVVEVFSELKAEFGERLTADEVRTAVEKKLKPKPPKAPPAPEVDQIALARQTLARAYDRAALLVVEWLEDHPGEDLEQVCRRIAPKTWSSLAAIVTRQRGKAA